MEEGHAIPLTSVYVPCNNFSSMVAAFASFFDMLFHTFYFKCRGTSLNFPRGLLFAFNLEILADI